MDTLTELTGSSLTPEEINKRVIGSLVNKNTNIRNLNLMRNIGKYPLYDFPMFPEIGMVYNVYEHLLNRPVRHYTTGNTSWSKWKSGLAGQFNTGEGGFLVDDTRAINGLIEFNNDITEDLNGSDRFSIVSDGEREKIVYTPNSGSMGLEGGPGLLSTVKAKINEEFTKRKSYAYKVKDFGLDKDGTPYESNESDGTSSPRVGVGESINQPKFYVNGDKKVIENGPVGGQVWNSKLFYHDERDKEGGKNYGEGVYSGANVNNAQLTLDDNTNHEKNSSLLNKTNYLFSTGKIKSLINRYQTQDGLSRGRALLSEKGEAQRGEDGADGYDNPWCRVWTVTKQFSKMTDLVRPFVQSGLKPGTEYFYRLFEVQNKMFNSRPGLRPNDGATRLSSMSTLQSNGLPTFSPYQDGNGNIIEDSVKRCMFSIENLAWRDVKAEHKTKFTLDGKSATYVETETLTKEQRGPNGGRIMWFPPYNLKFTENVSAKWNNSTFLGRGEDIYTYANTERGGTLSFTLLIDHPMVVDNWQSKARSYGADENGDGERRILRFFAGCDEFLHDNIEPEDAPKNQAVKDDGIQNIPSKDANPEFEKVSILIPIFYPNNYSGVDDRDGGKLTTFIDYMFHGDLCKGEAYESKKGGVGSELISPIKYTGGKPLGSETSTTYHSWHYKIDNRTSGESQRYVGDDNENVYTIQGNFYEKVTDSVIKPNNFDNLDFGLNNFNGVDKDFEKEYETAFARYRINKLIYGTNLFSITNFVNILEKSDSELNSVEKHLKHILNDYGKNITDIDILGHASAQGTLDSNNSLSRDRAETLEMLLKLHNSLKNFKPHFIPGQEGKGLSEILDTSSREHKLRRVSIAVIHLNLDNEEAFKELGGVNSATAEPDNKNTTDISGENSTEVKKDNNSSRNLGSKETVVNKIWNYDDEYKYFQRITEENSVIRSRILEKIQYFDPVYHSISPEGFNARLTFLHQCTRQGPSFFGDTSNMAFGRAPYCVLRIGDFYNTKIVIDSISIDYGENQWDLNPEGAGVQPIMANVQLNFKFIGGSDISGPIDRLQNAISFNYYGNTSIYDRRADYRNGFIEYGDNSKNPVNTWIPEMKDKQVATDTEE